MAEIYIESSPYNYTMNNPIRYLDPNGMYSTEEWKKDNGITDDDCVTIYQAPPDDDDNSNNNGMPDFSLGLSGETLEDAVNVVSEAFFNTFFVKETVSDGESRISVKPGVAAFTQKPVAVIISGNVSGSLITGGFDFEQGIIIVFEGKDKGAYQITDMGGVLASTNVASGGAIGKVTPVFFSGNRNDFNITDHINGTRTELNVTIGPPVGISANFGGFKANNKDKTQTYGLYIGAGGTASYKSLGIAALQLNIGGSQAY